MRIGKETLRKHLGKMVTTFIVIIGSIAGMVTLWDKIGVCWSIVLALIVLLLLSLLLLRRCVSQQSQQVLIPRAR